MSRKTVGIVLRVSPLIALALSGCQSSNAGLPFTSWMHQRSNAFADAPTNVSPSATAAGAKPLVASNDAKAGSQAAAINQPVADPYAAGADATMAASSGAYSASGPSRSSACTSGCCSR